MVVRLFIWLCLLGPVALAQRVETVRVKAAQPLIVLHDATEANKYTNLQPYIQLYAGTFRDSIQIDSMQQTSWKMAGTGIIQAQRKGLAYSGWVRFVIQNTNATDTIRLLYYGGYDLSAIVYALDYDSNSILYHFQTGWLRNAVLPVWARNGDSFALPITIPPVTQRIFWVNSQYYYAPQYHTITDVKLLTPVSYVALKSEHLWQNRWIILFIGSIMSACILLIINGLTQFIVTKDNTYVGWIIYLMGILFFFLRSFELCTNLRIMSSIIPNYYLLALGFTQNGAQVGYFIFFDSFLKIRQHNPSLHRAIFIFLFVLLCFLLYSLTAFFGPLVEINPIRELIRTAMDGITFLFVIVILVITNRKKIPLSRFLIIGSTCMYVGVFITFYINRTQPGITMTYPWQLPSFYLAVGILIELFLFSVALSFRHRLVEKQKNQLQRDYTTNLEIELSKRTQEVREQSSLAEEMRVQQLMSAFDQKLSETEMLALRSQMNPHFIFNCLNSIQYFTAQNDAETASDYLTKFSRLIRLVLENSRSERVTLANELETLRLYIEMEAMRFGQKVRYSIIVEPTVDVESIQIPPLLIQPFVENAIWHGLMHKPDGGSVTVAVQQPQDHLLEVSITDDGVGRIKAAAYKSKSATSHKSFGMKVTAERIDLINQMYHTHTQVRIDDLTDAAGQPTGTRVTVEIPI